MKKKLSRQVGGNIRNFKRLPKHLGVIPDGNRRWAHEAGLKKQDGYQAGLQPGLDLYRACIKLGIKELTFYGFTVDNTKRPRLQVEAFQNACVDAVEGIAGQDADLLVIGNTESPLFPKVLEPYTKRTRFGKGLIKVNFLVNYGWKWDLNYSTRQTTEDVSTDLLKGIASRDISRMDLIVRWGGRRRLSGFLPIQSIYSDFYVVDEMWPRYDDDQFFQALDWYQDQDLTLGG